MLTEHDLTPAEATAVYRASEHMREWREHYEDRSRKRGNSKFKTSLRGKDHPGRPALNPSEPIEQLRERGKIDTARDARLTALAYRLSLAGTSGGP